MGEHTPWPHDETLHAWWVEPGRLLAGEYRGARTPGKAMTKLQLLVDAGIESIVDLTTSQDPLKPYEEQLRAVARKWDTRCGISLIPFPTWESSTRPPMTRY
jgi:hypothetical protein